MPLRLPAATIAVALVLALSCARHSTRGVGARQQSTENTRLAPGRGSAELITDKELADVRGASLYEAIERLRPEFFKRRLDLASGPTLAAPAVSLDGSLVGELDALRSIPIDAVRDVRFLRTSQAKDRFGAYCRCEGGVILVRSRHFVK